MRRFAWLIAAAALAFFAATPGWAQQTTNGMFGSRSLGGSISGGSSPFGNQAQGSVAGATLQGDSTTGTITGSERFLRENRQPGQFVGTDMTEAQNFVGSVNSGGNLQGGLLGLLGGITQSVNANNRSNTTTIIRVSRRAAFDYPPPAAVVDSTQLSTRLSATPGIRSVGALQVEVAQRTAILRGTVQSDHDREIAEILVRLEPGISEVRNELQVQPASMLPPPPDTAPTAPPAGS